MDNLFATLAKPISEVTGSPSGSYGGLLNAKPSPLPAASAPSLSFPKSPTLSLLSKPIAEVAPSVAPSAPGPATARLAPLSTPSPSLSLPTPSGSLSLLSKPLKDIIPQEFKNQPVSPDLPQSDVHVRTQNWKDVINLIPQLVGGALEPAAELGGTALQIANERLGTKFPTKSEIPNFYKEQGNLPVDSAAPEWFRNQLQSQSKQPLSPEDVYLSWQNHVEQENASHKNAMSSQTLQDSFQSNIEAGDSPTKAYLKTAFQGGLDIAFALPLSRILAEGAQGLTKLAAMKTAPQTLITPEVLNASKSEIFDFLSGRTTAETSPLPPELQELIKEAPDKKPFLQGIDLTKVKPSRLGEFLGVSQDEAEKLLTDTYGEKVRTGTNGALPGYREKPFDPLTELKTAGQRGALDINPGKELEPVGFEKDLPEEEKPSIENIDTKETGSTEEDKALRNLKSYAPSRGDLPKRAAEYSKLAFGAPIDHPTMRIPVGDNHSISHQALKHIVEQRIDQGADHRFVVSKLPEVVSKPQVSIPNSRPGTTQLARYYPDIKKAIVAVVDKNGQIVTSYFKKGKDFDRMKAAQKELKKNTESPAGGSAYPSSRIPEGKPAGSLSDFQQGSPRSSDTTVAKPERSVKESYPQEASKETRSVNETVSPVTAANRGATPPLGRNGAIRPPEVNFFTTKDRPTLALGRDTMERNLEKVFSKEDAPKLNDFLVEATRKNDLEKTHYVNDLRRQVRAKMEELGLKQNTDNDALIQVFGEGKMTLEDLRRASPKKWIEIQKATDYFRNLYDKLINDWNAKRRVYGYRDVSKRPNYFRHFDDINEWTRQFGLLEKDSQLPTEIAGKTANFKPGKPFSTAEMHRTGDRTKFSAIRGMDNYLESVGRQMFHIDSVQRGRVLTKYIDEVAKASRETPGPGEVIPTPLKLPNFAANLGEWTNLVAGKAALFDRAVESLAGRPIVRFMQKIKDSFGRNVISGNLSAAISHSIPVSFNLATTETVPAIRGLIDTLSAPLRKDSLVNVDGHESSFLTRRFPERYIQPTSFNRAADTLGFIFHTVDEFISRLAVSSKYYELKGHGLEPEEAMKKADNYAQRVIGDRSIGNLPNIMNTRTLGFITQFQVEINDNLQVLTHDIPKWSEESGKKKRGIAMALVKFAIYSYLFNRLYKEIKGSGKGLDPINMGLTLMGLNDDGAGQSFGGRLKTVGSELLGELPFSSLATGNFPLQQAAKPVVDAVKSAASGDFAGTKPNLIKAASEFLSPVGGGAQALKTYQGIEAVKQGGTETATGKKKTDVTPTVGHYVKGALFGPGALNADANSKANDLYNRLSTQKTVAGALSKEAEALDTELQGMSPADANAKAAEVAKSDPALFAKLKIVVSERKAGLTQEERLMKQLGVANQERARYVDEQVMKIQGATATETSQKRNAYLRDLVDKKVVTPAVLDQIKAIRQNGESLPVVESGSKATSHSIIGRVATYAKAIGVDPKTAFERIFSEQTIKDVRNGTVIVERMPLSESSQAKRDLGGGSDMTLDHIVPLELGGSNEKDNLKLVAKDQAAKDDKVENFLGDALNKKIISKSQAQSLIVDYKNGKLTADEVYAKAPGIPKPDSTPNQGNDL